MVPPVTPDVDDTWAAFAARHPGCAFLDHDPLYALSESAIDAVLSAAPAFFSTAEERFERDLARTAMQGFFLRRPIGGPSPRPAEPQPYDPAFPRPRPRPAPPAERVRVICSRPELRIGEFLDDMEYAAWEPAAARSRPAPFLRQCDFGNTDLADLCEKVLDLTADLSEAAGRSRADVLEARAQESRELGVLRRREEAFASWLLSQAAFRSELGGLRARWSGEVARRGGFPDWGDEAAGPCGEDFRAFYGRWCLEGLLTWELPLPLRPALSARGPEGGWPGGLPGVWAFVPWHALRGESLDMRRVFARLRFEGTPENLRGWLELEESDASGELAYQRMFWLYRGFELVLYRRYAGSLKGNISELDRAFGEVVGRGAEVVRKSRQAARRLLGGTG